MKKVYLSLYLTAAGAGLLFVASGISMSLAGCGSSGGTSGSPTNCNSDADCTGTATICNTAGHVCMTKCSQGSDCPDTAKNCAAVPGGATSTTVCQCQTAQLCGGGSAICDPVDLLCETKCSDNSGCQGFSPARTCDTATGRCVAGTTNTDAGPGDCVTTPSLCTAGQVCDATTHQCKSNSCNTSTDCTGQQACVGGVCTTCSPANAQGGCDQGLFCDGSGGAAVCTTPPSCAAAQPTNITAPSDATSSPVIWGIVQDTSRTDTSGTCTDTSTGDEAQVLHYTGNFYSLNGMPTSGNAAVYGAIYYVEATTVPGSTSAGNTQEKTSFSGANSGTFGFELCAGDSNNSVAAAKGVVIKDLQGKFSNVACLQ
jgi:hypothetical protein